MRDPSAVRDAAIAYVARGWQVVPLVPGDKACKDEDWTRLIFTPNDFRDDDNIGIRSVDGLVDVDCDAAEVVGMVADFLPATGAVYGRPAKPRAHWLYTCPGVDKPVVHKDLETGATLIELRVKHQSMAPPSVHPDGQTLTWEGGAASEATVIASDVLTRAVRLLATAAIVARYYNPPGARHEWGLALAGTLRQFGLALDEVQRIFAAAGKWAHDHEVKDRLDAARTTFNRPEDDPTAGPKKFLEVAATGKTVLSSLRRIWGSDALGLPTGLLQKLNERHAVVFQQSGDLVVVTEDRDPETNRELLRFSTLETVRQLYPQLVTVGSTANGRSVTKKLGQAWLDSPKRRFYNGIELSPNGSKNGYYNLWRGFSVEPKAGVWSSFREHILKIVCNGDEAIFRYVLGWMAQAVQDPGHPGYTAIALRGGQGTGKSSFCTWFGRLFGQHFLHLDSTRHLTGNFNAHLHNAIVVFADEAAWPGDRAGLGALRRMVTEETLSIERKGADVFTVKNVIHLLLASNEDWVWPAALDERRCAVIDISPTRQNDKAYFAALEKELFSQGGLAAMLYDLMQHKIDVNLKEIPQTQALYEQKQLSSDSRRRWWYQTLYDGDLWKDDGECRIDRDRLYDDYVSALDRASSYGRAPKGLKIELGMFLKKVLPGGFPKDARGKDRRRAWVIPPLTKCRATYEKTYGVDPRRAWAETSRQDEPFLIK